MNRFGAGAGIGLAWAAALMMALPTAQAQSKQISDKTVSALMRFAWSTTPEKFTSPAGKVIEVDKTKFKDVTVPMETAREIIRVGRLSAHAQICGLSSEQTANYRTLMRREEAKGKWSDQQLLYINQLHLFTVMAMTGQVSVTEQDLEAAKKDAEKKAAGPQAAAKGACTDAQRKTVESQIMAYIKQTPASPAAKEAVKKPAAPAAGQKK